MSRKQESDCPPVGAPGWMATYGDLMTLILCFFVLLFGMSTIDEDKLDAVAQSMANVFNIQVVDGSTGQIGVGNLVGNGIAQLPNSGTGLQDSVSQEQRESQAELRDMASDFKTYFAENDVADQIDVEVTDEYIKLTFPNAILFDIGRADLKPESIPVLEIVASELIRYPDNDIKIEGHTDNIPISTPQFPSNWELSGARAIAVTRFFVDEKGFSPYRLSQEGFGEYRPEFPNDTAENRARNRRVVIKIMGSYESARN